MVCNNVLSLCGANKSKSFTSACTIILLYSFYNLVYEKRIVFFSLKSIFCSRKINSFRKRGFYMQYYTHTHASYILPVCVKYTYSISCIYLYKYIYKAHIYIQDKAFQPILNFDHVYTRDAMFIRLTFI